MTFLVACLLVGPPSFAAGWYANTWWRNTRLRARLDSKRVSDHLFTVMFALLVVGLLVNIVYTNLAERAGRNELAASEARQLERQHTQLVCLSRTFNEFLSGNQALRDASSRRDRALVRSKEALRDLVLLRVIRGVQDSPQVRAAAQTYLDQTAEFLAASQALVQARKDYRLPDFERLCGVTK